MQQQLQLTDKQITRIVWIILCLHPLIGMGIDLIAPSLPAIQLSLHTTVTLAKQVVAVYLLGYALGNFGIGLLADALPRRPLIICSLALFCGVSVLPIWFAHAPLLLCVRGLQGMAMAVLAVASRALFIDILPAPKLAGLAAMISVMWGIGPIIGPVIGGYLQYYFNWQANFYFFAMIGGLGVLATVLYIPETHVNRGAINLKQSAQNFMVLFTDRFFVGLSVLMGMNYSLLVVFNTVGPFLFQVQWGWSSVRFGQLALGMGVIFLCGSTSCRYLVTRYPAQRVIAVAIHVFFALALLGVVCAYVVPHPTTVIVASLSMFLACGIMYPAALGKALSLFPQRGGSSSAACSLLSLSVTSCAALLMGFIHPHDAVSMNLIYVAFLCGSMLLYYLAVRQQGPVA